ncbi:hypothetical protein ACFWFX_36070 [Streptomyces roseolus]|uniref:hypothetical protein n=1 Tax=Streptomyces roseolus TaxID=67358 RepID=UPI00364F835D
MTRTAVTLTIHPDTLPYRVRKRSRWAGSANPDNPDQLLVAMLRLRLDVHGRHGTPTRHADTRPLPAPSDGQTGL